MNFILTLTSVGVLLLYAIPGFILSKCKAVKTDSLAALSKILLYACQPCLCLYTFNDVDFSWGLFKQMGIFLLVATVIQIVMLLGVFFIFLKKQENVRYRIYTVASCFSNCMFFGVPILKALLPDQPKALVFANMYFLSMSVLGWTVACAIMTHDKKYISAKKIFLNPSILTMAVVIPMFIFGIKLPTQLYDPVKLMGQMTTPLCMLIMGIRLGSMSFKKIFGGGMQYVIVAVNQLVYPLLALGISLLIPFWEEYIVQTMFIIACCPVASVVLNFAEMVGEGQEEAANMLLLGTILAVGTMPLMLLII
ncbi:MAG: AEC family transporter [Clostridia bacterium]|nr:AEC family transporter [Clostridia bacterium]